MHADLTIAMREFDCAKEVTISSIPDRDPRVLSSTDDSTTIALIAARRIIVQRIKGSN
jgi:hypothetical protein